DNPVGKGTGKFRDQRLFHTQYGHAALVPLMGLVKLVCHDSENQKPTQTTQQDQRKPWEVHLNKIRKLTCTICMELFRSPRFLPCFHTFCLQCLEQLAKQPQHRTKQSFPCPTCRELVPVPLQGLDSLQVNFYLEDDVEDAQKAEGNQANTGTQGLALSHQLQQDSQQLTDKLAEHNVLLAEYQEQKQRLRQRVRELEKETKQQKILLDNWRQENQQLQQEVGRLLEESVDYRQTTQRLQQEVHQLQADKEKRERELTSSARETQRLKQKNSQLSAENKQLKMHHEQSAPPLPLQDTRQKQSFSETCKARIKYYENKVQQLESKRDNTIEQLVAKENETPRTCWCDSRLYERAANPRTVGMELRNTA
ncbi:hypothetical protein BaRGS_00025436, partial [Batillaria attramentaria]